MNEATSSIIIFFISVFSIFICLCSIEGLLVSRASSLSVVGSDSNNATLGHWGKSSHNEVRSSTSWDSESSRVSSTGDLDSNGGEWDPSVLPSDVELFVLVVETSVQVPDSVNGSLGGTARD
jgi:hypothetical protein